MTKEHFCALFSEHLSGLQKSTNWDAVSAVTSACVKHCSAKAKSKALDLKLSYQPKVHSGNSPPVPSPTIRPQAKRLNPWCWRFSSLKTCDLRSSTRKLSKVPHPQTPARVAAPARTVASTCRCTPLHDGAAVDLTHVLLAKLGVFSQVQGLHETNLNINRLRMPELDKAETFPMTSEIPGFTCCGVEYRLDTAVAWRCSSTMHSHAELSALPLLHLAELVSVSPGAEGPGVSDPFTYQMV